MLYSHLTMLMLRYGCCRLNTKLHTIGIANTNLCSCPLQHPEPPPPITKHANHMTITTSGHIMSWPDYLIKDNRKCEHKVVRLLWDFDCLHFAQYITIGPHDIYCKQAWCKVIHHMDRVSWLTTVIIICYNAHITTQYTKLVNCTGYVTMTRINIYLLFNAVSASIVTENLDIAKAVQAYIWYQVRSVFRSK